MTLTELVDKLIILKNDSKNADKEVRIYLEDDYNTIDIIVDKIDIITLDNKEDIYLSGVIGVDTVGGAEYRWQLNEFLSKDTLNEIKEEVKNNFNKRRQVEEK